MRSILLSILVHGAVVGAFWVGRAPVRVTPNETAMSVELVEEQHAVETATGVSEMESVHPISAAPAPPIERAWPVGSEGAAETKETETEDREDIAQEEHAKIISAPQAMSRITPTYPRRARKRGKEGDVTVEIGVDAEGHVTECAIVASSGSRDLDAAAQSAVRSAHFAPAREDGEPVSGTIRLTFEFRLR